MKQALFFLCLLTTGLSAQTTTDDHIRARSSFRIGATNSTAARGITNRVVTNPGADTLVTSRGVYNWVTGLTFGGDVSGLYNSLTLANSGVTAGTCTNCSLTIDAKGRVTVKGSGSAGATYTAGSGIAISGGNEISNTGDLSTTNELQNLSLTGQALAISSGTGVTLPVINVTAGNGVTVTPVAGSFAIANNISNATNGLAVSANGALSAPAMTGTGAWITGGSATTNKPYFLLEPTGTTSTAWSTAGTGVGINAPSGFTGNSLDLQLAGVSKFKVSSAGGVTSVGSLVVSSGTVDVGIWNGNNLYPGTSNAFERIAGDGSAATSLIIYGPSHATKANVAEINTASTNRITVSAAGLTTLTGSLTLSTAGSKINIATGSNASIGTATLASGTVTVSTTAVTSSSQIIVCYNTPSGTLASGLSAPSASIVNGTSFVINSLTTAGVVNTFDTSTVRYWIIN